MFLFVDVRLLIGSRRLLLGVLTLFVASLRFSVSGGFFFDVGLRGPVSGPWAARSRPGMKYVFDLGIPLRESLGALLSAVGPSSWRTWFKKEGGLNYGPPPSEADESRLGALLGRSWGRLGAVLGPSSGSLAPSWGHLEASGANRKRKCDKAENIEKNITA